MRVVARSLVIALAATVILTIAGAGSSPSLTGSAEAQFRDMPDALIILDAEDYDDTIAAQEYIEARGGKVDLIFPNRVLLGRMYPEVAAAVTGIAGIRSVHFDRAEGAAELGVRRQDELYGLDFWNYTQTVEYLVDQAEAEAAIRGGLFEMQMGPQGRRDGLINPLVSGGPTGLAPADPRPSGTPTMTGRNMIMVLFVESNGKIDPDTENWGTRWKKIKREIIAGLKFWTGMAPGSANLSYVVRFKKPNKNKTGYEPITRGAFTGVGEAGWINEIMDKWSKATKGQFYMARVTAYNDKNAKKFKAAGAATVFVVDSLNDADGMFADDWFAYAFLGGPHAVLTYDNDGWGPTLFDVNMSHEIGHLVGRALDEYLASGCKCGEKSANGTKNEEQELCQVLEFALHDEGRHRTGVQVDPTNDRLGEVEGALPPTP